MRAEQTFARSFESIGPIVAFTAAFFEREGVDARLLPNVDLVLEELFTNMVKYGGGEAGVAIAMEPLPDGVTVTLVDDGVERFDVTRSPEVDTRLPLAQRQPGRLGLHLVRRLVDTIEYAYSAPERQARITFRITRRRPITTEDGDARD
jgi:anti-sigma regulatory factor (Ser/Thr protein kinase)